MIVQRQQEKTQSRTKQLTPEEKTRLVHGQIIAERNTCCSCSGELSVQLSKNSGQVTMHVVCDECSRYFI